MLGDMRQDSCSASHDQVDTSEIGQGHADDLRAQ
jgi:hypothetical protein